MAWGWGGGGGGGGISPALLSRSLQQSTSLSGRKFIKQFKFHSSDQTLGFNHAYRGWQYQNYINDLIKQTTCFLNVSSKCPLMAKKIHDLTMSHPLIKNCSSFANGPVIKLQWIKTNGLKQEH